MRKVGKTPICSNSLYFRNARLFIILFVRILGDFVCDFGWEFAILFEVLWIQIVKRKSIIFKLGGRGVQGHNQFCEQIGVSYQWEPIQATRKLSGGAGRSDLKFAWNEVKESILSQVGVAEVVSLRFVNRLLIPLHTTAPKMITKHTLRDACFGATTLKTKKICKPLFPLQHSKTPWTPNLSKVCPSGGFWGFQSGGLEFVKDFSKFVKRTFSTNFGQIPVPLTGIPENNRWDKFWTNLGFGAFLNAVRGKGVCKKRWQTLRAKGALISEPRFSNPCEMRLFPREKGKTAFSRKKPSTKAVFLFSEGKIASRRG